MKFSLTLEQGLALEREFYAAKAGDIQLQKASGDNLADDRLPFAFGMIRSLAEYRQLVMPGLGNFLGLPAAQHIDDVRRAEALAGRRHRSQGELGFRRAVSELHRI